MTKAEFEAVYNELHDDMIKTAENMFRGRSIAEDLVQQVFYKTLERGKLASLDPDRNVRAFLFSRLIWDARRLWASKVWTLEPLEHADYEENGDEDICQNDEDMRLDVQTALSCLSPMYKQIVEMVAIEGYTFKEVGARLWPDRPLNSARQRAGQLFLGGVAILQHSLADYGNREHRQST